MKHFGCFSMWSRLIFLRLKFLSSPVVIYYCCCFYYSKDASIKKMSVCTFRYRGAIYYKRSVPLNVFGGTIETLFLVLDHLSAHY